MEAAVFYNNGGTWETVERGYMSQLNSANYCFDQPLSLVQGGEYRFRLYTKMKSGNRMVMIMSDSSTWDAPNRSSFDYDYTIPSTWVNGGSYTLPLQTFTANYKNLSGAGIVRKLIGLADSVGYPEQTTESTPRDIEIYINQEWTAKGTPENCYTQMSDNDVLRIALCIPPMEGGNGATAIHKFQFGHELGHAVGAMTGSSAPTSYNADSGGNTFDPGTERCKCPVGTDGARANHCIQSREYISTAAGESFASYISTVLFNYRTSEAWFNYYKKSDASLGGEPPNWLNWSEQHQWMRTNCVPAASDVAGLGAELDWAELYWQLWQGGTGRFDVYDITSLWRGAAYPYLCCYGTTECAMAHISNGQLVCVGIRGLPNPTLHRFGPMWEHRSGHPDGLEYLVTRAQELVNDSLLTSDQYNRFNTLGNELGVNGNP